MSLQIISEWLRDNGFERDDLSEKLSLYAERIHVENQKFNLTGYKSVEDIAQNLIIGSASPVIKLNVPRGTRYIDIGTGSGVPGVIIGLLFPDITGVLVDANQKKIDFISGIICDLGINNIKAVSSRIELYSRENLNSYDFCFTRAFGPLFYSYEFGLPLLKQGGMIYIYSNINVANISKALSSHVSELGGEFQDIDAYRGYGLKEEGLLVKKINDTPVRYPRNFPVVKREAARIPEVE